MAIGRNEPCPCGSGLKYKNCCADKSKRGVSKGLIALLAAIGVVAAIGVFGALSSREEARPATANVPAPTTTANPMQPGRPQPPGPTPPGKVWDVAHGHWHDAAPAGAQPIQITPGAAPGTTPINISPGTATAATPQTPFNAPQPDGPPPPGKVWSREHGHWHDAPRQ